MKIHDEVMKNLVSLPFLKGSRDAIIPIKQIKNLQEAEKSITSLKWENYCLDKIEVTSEVVEGIKVNGRLQFIVENGTYITE